MAQPTKAELLAQAQELGIEVSAEATNKQIAEAISEAKTTKIEVKDEGEATPVEVKTPEATPEAQTGNAIADAISTGLANALDSSKPKIKIETDPAVQSRFSIVKNSGGEIFVRDNSTSKLSELQLESIEEKNAAIQGEEVQEL